MDNVTKIQILLYLELIVLHSTSFMWILYMWYILSVKRRQPARLSNNRRWEVISKQPNQLQHLRRLTQISDVNCIDNLRMDRNSFARLCYLLQNIGGLGDDRFVSVPTKVAMFLSILAHHKKIHVVKGDFAISGHTVSKYFKQTLRAVLRISRLLLVDAVPISNNCNTEPWKHFKGCLGALDGTYVEVCVKARDQTKYRTRKGQLSVNVLGVCNMDMNFTYVLAGWEGSAADSRVLRDAVTKENGLKIPTGSYYLCDCGYTNAEGFLTPYRGTRYHLKEWGQGTLAPQNPRELFNLRHSKARNVIERTFCLLKGRWAILRSKSFYPIKVQNWTILACALLHNFIRTQMEIDPIEEEVFREEEENYGDDREYIGTIQASTDWKDFRDNMANAMYQSWRHA